MEAMKLINSGFDNAKLYVLAVIAVLASSYLCYAAMTQSALITNYAAISLSNVTARSGSPADIQTAVNAVAAAGGGTVHVPAGNFTWTGGTVTIPGGVNVIGASYAGCMDHGNNWASYTATTILHNTVLPADDMFSVDGRNGRATRISGIQFESKAPTNAANEAGSRGIYLWQCLNYRVDHCTFINFIDAAVFPDANDGDSGSHCAYGVIDHCVVNNPYKLTGSGWLWGYGLYARGDMKPHYNNWDTNLLHFLGIYGPIPGCSLMYVEDCHFSYCRHCTDGLQGNWNVVRFNLCDHGYPNYGSIDLHGSSGTDWYGGRGMEVYNNTVIGVSGSDGNNAAVRLRGGAGFIYNNNYTSVDSGSYCVQLDNYDYDTSEPLTNINNTYVWSNTYSNCIGLNVLQGTQNVNYFLRAPSQSSDGFTYIPYTYPTATE
jgi:hypothetical protein